MADNLLRNIVIFAAFFCIANSLLPATMFHTLIKQRCYNRTHRNDDYLVNGQNIPLSSSMETLIGLIESFEANYTMYSPAEVAEKFLTRFRIDGLQRLKRDDERDYSFHQNALDENRDKTIKDLLFPKPSKPSYTFPEEAFTEEEKCALYFMMSHTFTFCSTDDNAANGDNCYLEKGVASLYDHEVHAIAPGRVLLGILAGLKNLKEISIKDVLGDSIDVDLLSDRRKNYLKDTIDPLFAVTVGDVVVEEMKRVETDRGKRKFGPNGKWNSTQCPVRYKLDHEPTKATYAELRGAGDGVLLGLRAKEMSLRNEKIKISSLLRMYYSKHGIETSGSGRRYSYCDRYNQWKDIDEEITRQILNYAKLLDIKSPFVSSNVVRLENLVNGAMSEFDSSRDRIGGSIDTSRCNEYDTSPCEKQSDVFVVMDTRENEATVEERQKKIISNLVTYLDIRPYGGSMSVMSLSRGTGDRQLEFIVSNTTLKGCIGCLVDWSDPDGSPEEEHYVFQSINRTLMNFEKEKEMYPGVPGKVLIYFNYASSPPRDSRQLKDALWEVHNKHRDVPVFAIGESSELLKTFATDGNVLTTEESIVQTLTQEICETFSTLQYPHCWERKSSFEDASYEGYITKDYTQYWAMYPEYFLKSFDIKFLFSAENGQIKVCYSRDKTKDKLQRYCRETSGNERERTIEFTMSNPCKGKNVYNCSPFYFTIIGKERDINAKPCTDKRCKYTDQIKFTVRHEGVSCNGSSCFASSLKITVVLLAIFYMIRNNI